MVRYVVLSVLKLFSQIGGPTLIPTIPGKNLLRSIFFIYLNQIILILKFVLDCTSGVERLVTCQNHLVFDDASGNCEHPDAANRAGCTAEELYGFTCPNSVGQAR